MSLLHLYGFFIGLGILVGLWIAERINSKFQITNYPLPITNLLPWGLIPGIIGARLYHVIDYWQYYAQDPMQILYLWQGGLGIYGGIFGAVLGICFFSWKLPATHFKKTLGQEFYDFKDKIASLDDRQLPFLLKINEKLICWRSTFFKMIARQFHLRLNIFYSLLDLIAFGLPVGQAIGRIGNYFNQELYGLPTSLPWGIYINPENRLAGYENFSYFHPLFAYEAVWDVIIFMILITLLGLRLTSFSKTAGRKDRKFYREPGVFFAFYLFLYAFGRFWLEFLRIEPWQIGGLNVAQGISVGLMIISFYWLFQKTQYFRKLRKLREPESLPAGRQVRKTRKPEYQKF